MNPTEVITNSIGLCHFVLASSPSTGFELDGYFLNFLSRDSAFQGVFVLSLHRLGCVTAPLWVRRLFQI